LSWRDKHELNASVTKLFGDYNMPMRIYYTRMFNSGPRFKR